VLATDQSAKFIGLAGDRLAHLLSDKNLGRLWTTLRSHNFTIASLAPATATDLQAAGISAIGDRVVLRALGRNLRKKAMENLCHHVGRGARAYGGVALTKDKPEVNKIVHVSTPDCTKVFVMHDPYIKAVYA
jgi:hypothetical protein